MTTGSLLKTFLFTDLVSSTFLWEHHRTEMEHALEVHDRLLQDAVQKQSGRIIKTLGDGVHAVFDDPLAALNSAIDAQRSIRQTDWGVLGGLSIRVGFHIGHAQERAGDFYGPSVNMAARFMSIAHGGQIVLSEACQKLLKPEISTPLDFKDLGTIQLKGVANRERVFQVVHPDLESNFPSLDTSRSLFKNFPDRFDSFIARDDELESASNYLRSKDGRVQVMLGLGGFGKTRLAIQIAEENALSFRDGTIFVPCTKSSSRESIASQLLYHMGVGIQEGKPIEEQLLRGIETKEYLLVIDSFEYMIEHESLIQFLLDASPDSKFLITSKITPREIAGSTIRLKGLSFPRKDDAVKNYEEYEALKLFVDRARKNDQSFVVDKAVLSEIAAICRKLEGMPLAIEIAASWTGALSCADILAEIQSDVEFLSSSDRSEDQENANLRAAFESSWLQLDHDLQQALIRISLVQGAFDRHAAGSIAGLSNNMIKDLVNRSFLLRPSAQSYKQHESIRLYVEQLLRKDVSLFEKTKQSLRDYSESLYDQSADQLQRLAQPERLKESIDLMIQAWHSAVEDQDVGYMHVNARYLFHLLDQLCMFSDGKLLFENSSKRLNSSSEPDSELISKLRILEAHFDYVLGRHSEALEVISNALGILERQEPEEILGMGYQFRASCHLRLGQLEMAIEMLNRSLDVRKKVGDQIGISNALNNLGIISYRQGNYEDANQYYEESLQLRRRLAFEIGISASLNNLGIIAYQQNEFTRAKRLYEESLEISAAQGSDWVQATTLSNLGLIEMELKDFDRAQKSLQESFELRHKFGDAQGKAVCLNNMGLVAERTGQRSIAINLLMESRKIRERINDQWGLAYCANQLGRIYRESEDFENAESFYREAMQGFLPMKSDRDLSESILGFLMSRYELGKPDLLFIASKSLEQHGELDELQHDCLIELLSKFEDGNEPRDLESPDRAEVPNTLEEIANLLLS